MSIRHLSVLIAAAVFALASIAPADSDRPNIVLFLVDDMGWQDTSVPFWTERTPFNERYHTPAMQKLADTGVKFTQAYACAVCSPTRISLMTGLNAARHRVTNWTLQKNASNDRGHPRLEFPQWNVNGMSPEPGVERTVYAKALPAYLKEAGYRTIHAGKAHFGAIGTPGNDPTTLGFEVNIAGHAAGGPGSYLGTKNFGNKAGQHTLPWGVPGLEDYHGKDIFLTEALTLEANKAVDQAVADGKPFYLYLAHYAVHVPFVPDDRFYQKYRDAGLVHTEAMYAALVEGMDKSLGDIMANVEKHGLTDNTIFIFMSDNGGLSAHGRGGGPPHTHNKPLSSGKGSAHEGGIREPMIVRWPGVTKPGSACDTPVIIEDFFPTILELAGVTPPPHVSGADTTTTDANALDNARIDGISFVPLLKGQPMKTADRAFVWHHPNNWGQNGPGIGTYSSIRLGDHKLIYFYDPGRKVRYELYDIPADIGETTNLAEAEPELRDRLAARLTAELKGRSAQRPTLKATGEIAPWPGE